MGMSLGRQADRPRRRLTLRVEGLEGRQVLSNLLPNVAVNSAATADSHGLSVDYTVSDAPSALPITFGVYRSADAQFGPGDELVATETVAAASDGEHQLAIAPPGGLPIDPEHPYVLVVADPNAAIAESSRAE